MDDVEQLVPGAHRAIRRLEGMETPYAGVLVGDGDRQRVRMDAADVHASLWEFADAEHAAGVRDVLRTADGQAALLPWCIEPVDVFLARRTVAERPLSVGEAVTLVGSLLRGVAEVGGRAVLGRWWLDDRCRPLFVPGDGASCSASAVAIIERVRQDGTDRSLERVLARICADGADHRVVQRSLDDWERELTELAAPRALDRDVHAPERVRTIPVHRARLPQMAEELGERRRRPAEHLAQMRMRVAERVRALIPLRRARVDRGKAAAAQPRPRVRMLIVGGAAASAVLIAGLLWPGGGDDDAVPRAIAADATSAAVNDAVPGESQAETDPDRHSAPNPHDTEDSDPAPPAASEGDIAATAARLLAEIDRCRSEADAACVGAIVEGSGRAIQERLGISAQRDATLIEDYGDVAVVRLSAGAETGEQMLVLVHTEAGWLVRDVYDVADQPSGSG